ncbi:MAG: hypothetical protein ACKPKO_22030, partial [Candidatus Fonsibacter sp.]
YVAKDNNVTIGCTPYTRELWISSFNSEVNTTERTQRMAVCQSRGEVREFTPQSAQTVFPIEAMTALRALLDNPTPGIPGVTTTGAQSSEQQQSADASM